MAQLFKNAAASTLAANITALDTTITVADGAQFPTISNAGDFFVITLDDGVKTEIVKVTGHSVGSANLTGCTRGHESSTAAVFASPTTTVQIRVTAGLLQAFPTTTFQYWDPHLDLNTPNANSDEFDTGSSMGGSYTPVNLGTSTHDIGTTKPGSLTVFPQNSAGWRGWARALPSGDFTITSCITVNCVGANFTLAGIMLSTTASNGSGTSLNSYTGWNSRPALIGEFGSNWDSSGVSVVHNWNDIGTTYSVIMRLRRSGTTIYTGSSRDGRTFSEASRTDSTAYAYFGPSFYNSQGNTVTCVWDYLRYAPTATAVYGGWRTIYGT